MIMEFGDKELERLDARHPMYADAAASWDIMRNCFEGELSVKRRGAKYLPMLHDQSKEQYNVYQRRAYFYNATERAVEGAVGMLLPQGAALFQDEVASMHDSAHEWYNSLSGGKFSEFLRKICHEFALQGRAGILLDGAQKKGGFRPSLILCNAESIINWGFVSCEEGAKLKYVVLEETVYEPESNILWSRKEAKQWRVCYLDKNGDYCCAVYRKANGSQPSAFVRIQDVARPTRGGLPLKKIPFWILNWDGGSHEISNPPLLGLALLNLSHYRTTAALENGRFFAGVPTVFLAGANDSLREIRLGTDPIKLINPAARVGFVEMSGAGLASLERGLLEKERKMTRLGSRISEPERIRGSESAAAQKLRKKGEISVLSSMSSTLSAKISDAVQLAAWWSLKFDPSKYEVRFVQEFNAFDFGAGIIHEVAALVKNGLVSYETFFHALVRMEIISPGHSMEAELQKINEGKGSALVRKCLSASKEARVNREKWR